MERGDIGLTAADGCGEREELSLIVMSPVYKSFYPSSFRKVWCFPSYYCLKIAREVVGTIKLEDLESSFWVERSSCAALQCARRDADVVRLLLSAVRMYSKRDYDSRPSNGEFSSEELVSRSSF